VRLGRKLAAECGGFGDPNLGCGINFKHSESGLAGHRQQGLSP
jgi:hypothetical protein